MCRKIRYESDEKLLDETFKELMSSNEDDGLLDRYIRLIESRICDLKSSPAFKIVKKPYTGKAIGLTFAKVYYGFFDGGEGCMIKYVKDGVDKETLRVLIAHELSHVVIDYCMDEPLSKTDVEVAATYLTKLMLRDRVAHYKENKDAIKVLFAQTEDETDRIVDRTLQPEKSV